MWRQFCCRRDSRSGRRLATTRRCTPGGSLWGGVRDSIRTLLITFGDKSLRQGHEKACNQQGGKNHGGAAWSRLRGEQQRHHNSCLMNAISLPEEDANGASGNHLLLTRT